MREYCVALILVVVVCGLAGCTTADEPTASEPAGTLEPTATIEPTATVEESPAQPEPSDTTTIPPFEGPFTEESIYEFAAWLFSPYTAQCECWAVWRPTWLPDGFGLMASEPEMGGGMDEPTGLHPLVRLEWARGDDRIYYFMCVGEAGDLSDMDTEHVDWGTVGATLVRDVVYEPDNLVNPPLNVRRCTSVFGGSGAVQGVGVTEDEMKRITASMVLVEPKKTWEFPWAD